MSSQKTSNNDSCRDLSGRRLSTIKEAKRYVCNALVAFYCAECLIARLAEYIESEPLRKKAQQDAQKAKLEALEKKLGIERVGGADASHPLAGKKHRLDDADYVEESREIVDNVKNAVAASRSLQSLQHIFVLTCLAGFLKKKKKAKTSSPPAAESSTSAVAETVSSAATTATTTASILAEKILVAPETAPVALIASAAAGIASA